MKTRELRIDGMSCGHCVMAVRKELEKLSGVTVRDVSIGRAVIEYDESSIGEQDLSRAISEAGYRMAL